jgi:hypothetical protein
MDWQTINDDTTSKGLEFKQAIVDNVLHIYVKPTSYSSTEYIEWLYKLTNKKFNKDWLINFCFFYVPLDLTDWLKGFIHAGYKRYSVWLAGYIKGVLNEHPEIKNVNLTGYSFGAGIIQGTVKLIEDTVDVICKSIDNIITMLPQSNNMTMYYKKGGLYDRFSLFKAKCAVCTTEEKQSLVNAHTWTWEEIEGVINGIC